MKQNDYFIEESERVIQERTADGQFYILYTDITDFHLVNYIYGNEIGDSLLQEMNHFLDSRPNILLCRRLFADFFVGLYFLENGQEISEIISGLDRELQEFLTDLQSRYPACRLKAACGLCLIEHDNIAQAIDNANLARKISKNQYSFKTVVYDHFMKDQITAVLLEGSIRFESPTQQVLLAPDQQLTFIRSTNKIDIQSVNAKENLAWKDGLLKYKSIALCTLLNELEKKYEIPIHIENKKLMDPNVTVSGTFSEDQSLKEILQVISRSLPIKWSQRDGTYYIQ